MDTLLDADTLFDALLAFVILAVIIFSGCWLLLRRWNWRRWV
jgi:hypothetical protein